jgi:uncharacterized protein YqhQ
MHTIGRIHCNFTIWHVPDIIAATGINVALKVTLIRLYAFALAITLLIRKVFAYSAE